MPTPIQVALTQWPGGWPSVRSSAWLSAPSTSDRRTVPPGTVPPGTVPSHSVPSHPVRIPTSRRSVQMRRRR